jgi:hypothetical protein
MFAIRLGPTPRYSANKIKIASFAILLDLDIIYTCKVQAAMAVPGLIIDEHCNLRRDVVHAKLVLEYYRVLGL